VELEWSSEEAADGVINDGDGLMGERRLEDAY
jgi:hypothetical protein